MAQAIDEENRLTGSDWPLAMLVRLYGLRSEIAGVYRLRHLAGNAYNAAYLVGHHGPGGDVHGAFHILEDAVAESPARHPDRASCSKNDENLVEGGGYVWCQASEVTRRA